MSYTDRILFIQKTAGNQAIQRLMKSDCLQAKLRVGQPGDKYEQEADRVADAVMRMPEPQVQRQLMEEEEEEKIQAKPVIEQVQRQVEEEELRKQPIEEEEETLMTKSNSSPDIAFNLESNIQELRGQGQDIHLGPGQEKHLPHEGWHAVQQMQGRVKPTMQEKGMSTNDDAELEREADVMGARAIRRVKEIQGKTIAPGEAIRTSKGKCPLNFPTTTRGNLQMARSTRTMVIQQQDRSKETIQRVLGPPYPFQGIITTRWSAALRRTASRGGRFIANLSRNTRVIAIGNTRNWLEVQVTIDGRVETGFVSQELVGHIPAAGFAPAVTAGGRVEVTAFGTYNVYPNAHRGALQPNEVYEGEFQRLQTAWTRVGDNSGGMLSHGAAGDLAAMRVMIGRGMGSSQTFRNLIVEITEDTGHPVTINVGRNNAYWLDEFHTNRVDLSDIDFLDEGPRPGYEWAFTQGEDIVHWLAERRHHAVHGGGFPPAHAEPMRSGGLQEQYRADIGQLGRTVSQVMHGSAGGLHAGVYTDDAGNITRIRRDGSGGDPVPYEIRYEPAGGGAVGIRRNNIVSSVRSTSATAEDLCLKFTDAGHDVLSPAARVDSGAPLNFTTPLGGIVPTGPSVDVELYRKGRWIVPDMLLGTLTWMHPFERGVRVVRVGGVDYTISSELVMEP